MERIKSEDLSPLVPDRMGIEINVVGTVFNSMIEALMTFVEKVPLLLGNDIATLFVSAKEVGGDFFLVRVRTSHLS